MSLRTITLAAIAALALSPALADDEAGRDAHAIHVEGAYALVSPSGSGSVFFTLTNDGDADDTLIGVDIADDVAARTELHTHTMDEAGVMRMTTLEDGIPVPAGGTAVLDRGGDHVMLLGLREKLEDGASFPLVLQFAHAPEVTVEVSVGDAHAAGDGAHDAHSGHDMH